VLARYTWERNVDAILERLHVLSGVEPPHAHSG
jgi:hypothetical protein